MKVDFRPALAHDLMHRGSSTSPKDAPLIGFDDFGKIMAYAYHSIHAGQDNSVRVPRA